MDWQQLSALGIVAITAGIFVAARLRRRKPGLPCGSHCGCSLPAPKSSIRFHARKGERPQIIVKMK